MVGWSCTGCTFFNRSSRSSLPPPKPGCGKDDDGTGLCYRWNDPADKCPGRCRFRHKCRLCLSTEHTMTMCSIWKEAKASL